MFGGTIIEIKFSPEAVFLQVQGVGEYRDEVVEIPVQATNYQLRVGDLVWWSDQLLRWEGKLLPLSSELTRTGLG